MRQSIAVGSLDVASPGNLSSVAREAARWAGSTDLEDARRYDFTKGWDAEDAELGWVDADVVTASPRLH